MGSPKDGGGNPVEEMDFMPLITFLQKHGGMDWETILSFPLIRLYTIQESLTRHVTDEQILGAGSALFGSLGGAKTNTTANQSSSGGGLIMPEYGNRDAYFDEMNDRLT